MFAAFDDFAFVHDAYFVGVADGRQAVGDDDGGTVAHKVFKRFLHETFRFGIEGGGGFVEDENRGVFKDSAGDGDALALAAGEFDAAFAGEGVETFWQGFDKFPSVGEFGGFDDFFVTSVRSGVGDVFADSTVEKGGFLGDVGDVFAEGDLGDVFDVLAVDGDGAFADVGEAEEEFGEGGFAGTGAAD